MIRDTTDCSLTLFGLVNYIIWGKCGLRRGLSELTVSYGNVPLCRYMQSIFFQDQTFPVPISHGLDHHCLRI